MRTLSIVIVLFAVGTAPGQSPLLLGQDREGRPARNLTAAEFGALGDPFFRLVLRDHAGESDLGRIENLIQPDASQRIVLVVDENIRDKGRPAVRRAVLAFRGTHKGQNLEPHVMLSVFFSSEDFPDALDAIEAWGWDDHRGRYNYYRLDRSGTPDRRLTWKFRGSSVDADLLSSSDRANTCMACHVNGAPIMKELIFPWNNWHSNSSGSPAEYLVNATGGWPVATHPRLRGGTAGGGLADALELETMIISAVRNFNTRRVNQALERRSDNGNVRARGDTMHVVDGRRLLRHLFLTTEVNLISSRRKSGLHPLHQASRTGPGGQVTIPNSFFLNAPLIAGGGVHGYKGLEILDANGFAGFGQVQPDEYVSLVQEQGLVIARRPGDANFAWFGPEPSHIDNDMVDRLLRRGIVTPQFVAAALAIDLETPVLSEERASLWRFVPDSWNFKSPSGLSTHPDDLTQQVVRQIESTSPASNSVEAEFLQLLKLDDPIARLRERVVAYLARVGNELAAGGDRRRTELKRLFQLLIDRRKRLLDPSEPLHVLDETGGHRLFPAVP